jgi:DNA-directed RNA polymerase subunit F
VVTKGGFALPTPNVQYMLLTIGELKKVEGLSKLFKLQHLLQTEARLKFDEPDEENKMGYTAYGTLDNCIQNGLVKQSMCQIGFGLPRRDHELTESGIQLYGIIKNKIPRRDMEKIQKVLYKYCTKTGYELMEYTHKKYIDNFGLDKVPRMSEMHAQTINEIQNILQQVAQKNQNPDAYVMIGKLEHVKKILKVLPEKAHKKMQAGTLFSSIEDLETTLANAAYKPNDATEDIFNFIENYAEKEKIMESMASIDFATLPDEEQKCLSTFLNQVKPLLSS